MDYIVHNMKDLEKELIRIEELVLNDLDAIAETVLWDYEETGFSDIYYLIHSDFSYETWYHLHNEINRLKSKLIALIKKDNQPAYTLLKRLIKCQIRVDRNLLNVTRLLNNPEYMLSVKSVNRDFGYSRSTINKRYIKLNKKVHPDFTSSLYKALSDNSYIDCSIKEFNGHFSGEYEAPIKWLKAQNQLFYLINELFFKRYLVPEENLAKETFVKEHFSIDRDWNHNSINSGLSNPLPKGHDKWPIYIYIETLEHQEKITNN